MEGFESVFVEVAGGKIHCLRRPNPDKPVLLGFHGFADTCSTFQFILEPLLDRFEVVFADFRGHGDSSRITEGTYSAATYFGDAIALTGSLRRPLALMGHSMGAALSARLAGLYPEDFTHLILFEGFSGLAPPREDVRRLRSWGDQLRKNRPEKIRIMKTMREAELILKTAHRNLPEDRIQAMAKSLAKPVEGGFVWKLDPAVKSGGAPVPFSPQLSRELWKRIHCPVLFIYGEQSHLLPGSRDTSSSLDEILSHFQNLEKHGLEGCGHNPHHERPDEVMRLLSAFFQKHQPG
jgi:pimeloyl-ACP methyl ester carboxylesterase